MFTHELAFVALAIVLASLCRVGQSNQSSTSPSSPVYSPMEGSVHQTQPPPHPEQQTDFDIVTYARHKLAQLADPKAVKLAADEETDNSFAPSTNRPPIHSFSMIESKVQDQVEEDNPESEQEKDEKEFRRLENLVVDKKRGKKKKPKKTIEATEFEATRPNHHSEDDFNGAISDPNSNPVAARTAHLLRNIVTAKVLNKLDLKDHQHESFDAANGQTKPESGQQPSSDLVGFEHQENGAHLSAQHLPPSDVIHKHNRKSSAGLDVGKEPSEWKDSPHLYIPDDLPAPMWSQVIRSTNVRYEPLSEPVSSHRWNPTQSKPTDAVNYWPDSRLMAYSHKTMLTPTSVLSAQYQPNGQAPINGNGAATYVEIKPGNGRKAIAAARASFPMVPTPVLVGQQESADEAPLEYRIINHYTSVQYPTQTNEALHLSPHSELVQLSPSLLSPATKSPAHSHPAMSVPSDRHVPPNHRAVANHVSSEMSSQTDNGQHGGLHLHRTQNPTGSPRAEIARLVQSPNPNRASRVKDSAQSKWNGMSNLTRTRHAPNRRIPEVTAWPHIQPTSSLFGSAPNLWQSNPPFLISTPFVDNSGRTHFPVFQADPNHPALQSDPSTYDFDVDNADVNDFIASSSSPIGQLYPQLYPSQFPISFATFQSPWWLTS